MKKLIYLLFVLCLYNTLSGQTISRLNVTNYVWEKYHSPSCQELASCKDYPWLAWVTNYDFPHLRTEYLVSYDNIRNYTQGSIVIIDWAEERVSVVISRSKKGKIYHEHYFVPFVKVQNEGREFHSKWRGEYVKFWDEFVELKIDVNRIFIPISSCKIYDEYRDFFKR